MQQGVQTDATRNIQQCWELLANNVASVCTGIYKACSKKTTRSLLQRFLSWRKQTNYATNKRPEQMGKCQKPCQKEYTALRVLIFLCALTMNKGPTSILNSVLRPARYLSRANHLG